MVNITNEQLQEMVNTGQWVFNEGFGVFGLVVLSVVFIIIFLVLKNILKHQ